MKLSDQVITREQAQRLKELGVAQERSYFRHQIFPETKYRVYSEGITSGDHDVTDPGPWSAAFTVVELGEMLPGRFEFNGRISSWSTTPYIENDPERRWIGGIFWTYKSPDQPMTAKKYIPAPTEAQARAALLIYLLEKNFVKVEDVNKRLKE